MTLVLAGEKKEAHRKLHCGHLHPLSQGGVLGRTLLKDLLRKIQVYKTSTVLTNLNMISFFVFDVDEVWPLNVMFTLMSVFQVKIMLIFHFISFITP